VWRSWLVALVALSPIPGGLGVSEAPVLAGEGSALAFSHHLVAPPGLVSLDDIFAGDMDGDGRLDVFSSANDLTWYRNLGGSPPRWEPHGPIAWPHDWSGEQGWMGTALGDFDGDGDLDVVAGSKTDEHPTAWYENREGGTRWVERLLPVAGDYIDNSRVADLDGDGVDEVVMQEYHGGGVHLLDPGPRPEAAWTERRIGQGSHGLSLADIDRDGDTDVLVDNTWLENPGAPREETWPVHAIPGSESGMKNAAADLDGDGLVDVVLSSEEGAGIQVYWRQGGTGGWEEQVLSRDHDHVHTLVIADMDADGRLDLVTAEHELSQTRRVSVWRNLGDRRFVEQVISTLGSHNGVVADVDGNGRLDIVGKNWGDGNGLDLWLSEVGSP